MFYKLARNVMFQMDAEKSHDLAISTLSRHAHSPLSQLWKQQTPVKPVSLWGLEFKNPVGLAAGLDKNGDCIDAFGSMGFGFIEIGTITPRPQAGNEKPRLFRLPQAQAIINRMGFNNKGVDALVHNVKSARYDGILGINIGKNKDTPNEQGKDDYIHCMRKVYEHASYITVNISSPNTPGLRELQYGEALNDLIESLKAEQADLSVKHNKQVPLVVKIAPDVDEQELGWIADCFNKNQVDGVIATNTTLDRQGVENLTHGGEAGGLSGLPLQVKSQQVTEKLRDQLDPTIPIIGVGGINDGSSAKARMDAGASLVQVYTGFIYEGPELIKTITDAL